MSEKASLLHLLHMTALRNSAQEKQFKTFLDFGPNRLIGATIKGPGQGLLIFTPFNHLCSHHPYMSTLGRFIKIWQLLN